MTALRRTVPSAWASAGYFGGMLRSSRFSAPLEERMTAVSSPGNGAIEEVAAASFFLSLGAISLCLPVSGLPAMAGVMFAGAGGAAAVLAAGSFTETPAAADVVAEPLLGPVPALMPESADAAAA